MKKRHLILAAGAAALLALSGCASGDSLGGSGGSGGSKDSNSVTVGSANFSENVLLANIYAAALSDAGFTATVKPNIGSREVVIPALKDGSIDLVPEYSGALLSYLEPKSQVFSSEDVTAALKKALPKDLAMLTASPAEDKDTLVVTKATADTHGLTAIGDLKPVASGMVLGGPPENKDRRAGVTGLKELYGLGFTEFKAVDLGGPLTVAGLKNGDLDVAFMFTTQSAIAENGFVALEDPEHMALAENIVPVLRADRTDPKIEKALDRISAALTTEKLIEMNAKIEIEKQDPQKVARAFVDSL
ncbi:ABC transporter substrate-binding protein [Leucobacter sp. HNU]|uniref:ABC transporter substrate-binding protein n=1 Tax=Leucobacter sp. HNU TaxID=3236805 RepID=UPI003A7F8935